MEKVKIAIVVSGGIVQSVRTDSPNVEVIIQDFDNINLGDEDPFDAYTITDTDGFQEVDWESLGLIYEVW